MVATFQSSVLLFHKYSSSSSSSSLFSLVVISNKAQSNTNTLALNLLSRRPISIISSRKTLSSSPAAGAMDTSNVTQLPIGMDENTEEQFATHSKLLHDLNRISSIEKAWLFYSPDGNSSQVMFSVSQPNLLANKRRKFIQSANISKHNNNSVNFHWTPFPLEMTGVATILPSPSGSKLLVVRNPENESPTHFEIWVQSQLELEFRIPQSVHGPVYVDGWFEGISWNSDETHISYVAEEPSPPKPTFNDQGYKKSGSTDKDCNSWKGLGDWEEDWGETYAGKRQPALFILDISSGEVQVVKGIPKSLSVGQVEWAPSIEGKYQHLVFVGWSADPRKLGIKYCYNRRCALYAVRVPIYEPEAESKVEDSPVINLTENTSSAFLPRFSPDGKFLVFSSAKTCVDSGAHSATNSLHRIEWPTDGKLSLPVKVVDVIPVVLCAEEGSFPGLYCLNMLSNPWLPDGQTMIFSSYWGSREVILSVNVLSGDISHVTPADSDFSWRLLTLDGQNIVAVCSSPVDLPRLKYGFIEKPNKDAAWNWFDVSSPLTKCSDKIISLLSSRQFSILKIPVKDVSNCTTEGAKKPYEAIFVSSKSKKDDKCEPLIVILHGGPHSVSLTSYLKGSLGFGEEALQSLPGKIGSQDVNDVFVAIDHVVDSGLATPSNICVLGGSHGGFLTTHLIGQAPDKFVAACARNPVCNLAFMVGTTDIPEWCYVETFGTEGKTLYTEAPTPEHLALFHSKSPIAHVSKVKTPTLFLLGAQDLRVPMSNGIHFSRALKEKGVEVKVILFPNDVHAIERPQSDYESFLNIGVWFKKYCK